MDMIFVDAYSDRHADFRVGLLEFDDPLEGFIPNRGYDA
jgi:hypothetical protein